MKYAVMVDRSKKAAEIFYSFAPEDSGLRFELETHLRILEREGLVSNWNKRLIQAGTDWQRAIDTHLNSAQIILLLISADFLASDYCYGVEVQRAMERHKQGEARVIPIILRPVDWQSTPFGTLQPLPHDKLPVTRWSDRDEAFLDIVKGIREIIQKLPSTLPAVDNRPEASQRIDNAISPHSSQQLSTQSVVPPIPQSEEEIWYDEGALGDRISWHIEALEWSQAEAAARSTPDRAQRSRVMGKLVNAMVKVQQWQRAEAIARDIGNYSDKEIALTELAFALAEQLQWQRAEAVAQSIEDISDRAGVFRQLSRTARNAGERSRAQSLARESERLAASTETLRSFEPPPGSLLVPPLLALPLIVIKIVRDWNIINRYTSSIWYNIVLILILILAIVATIINKAMTLTILAWIIAGVLLILWIVGRINQATKRR